MWHVHKLSLLSTRTRMLLMDAPECTRLHPEGTPEVPKGKVFACFMVAVMIGASLYDAGSNAGITNEAAMAVALLVSAGSLGYSAVAWASVNISMHCLLATFAYARINRCLIDSVSRGH